jgi:hypothetical protein
MYSHKTWNPTSLAMEVKTSQTKSWDSYALFYGNTKECVSPSSIWDGHKCSEPHQELLDGRKLTSYIMLKKLFKAIQNDEMIG